MSTITLGILLALAVYFIYTVGDALVKGLGHRVGVFEIGFLDPLFALLPPILAILTKRPRENWREASRLVHPVQTNLIGVLRAIAATTGIFAYVTIPLAEAYCIIFLSPVLITAFSIVTLKEKVPSERWVLIIASFASVVMVVKPGFHDLSWGHLTAFGSAMSSSAATVLTRRVSTSERRIGLFLLPGLYTVALNAVVLSFIGFTWPSGTDLLLLLFAGLLNGVAFLMFLAALRMAPASRIAPMQYSQMAWALIIGALFFNEIPDIIGFIGVTLLICAGISNVVIDGARARIASRWAARRGRRVDEPQGPLA